MEIRSGNLADIPSITELLVDTWQKAYHNIFPSTFLDKLRANQQEQRHSRYMLDPKVSYIVIEQKERLVGFISFGPPRSDQMELEDGIEIYAFYIDQASQRNGFGTMLWDEAIKRSSPKCISVEVFKENPYFQFYTGLGFRSIGEGSIELGEHQADYWICEYRPKI